MWVCWELRLLRVRFCERGEKERGETESRGQKDVAWSIKTREWERAEDKNWDRENCGLSYKVFVQTVRFTPFVFLISAWIGRFSTGIGGFAQYGLSRRESARIGLSLRRIGASLEKKKKLDMAPTHRQQCPSRVGHGCDSSGAASMLPSLYLHTFFPFFL